jgi:hypothetical protein
VISGTFYTKQAYASDEFPAFRPGLLLQQLKLALPFAES